MVLFKVGFGAFNFDRFFFFNEFLNEFFKV